MMIRMEESQSMNHEDHNSGKGVNSLSHFNLVHKFIPMPEEMKMPEAKAVVEKVRNKNDVIAEAKNKCHTIHFASLMDLCHLKNSDLELQLQKAKCRVSPR